MDFIGAQGEILKGYIKVIRALYETRRAQAVRAMDAAVGKYVAFARMAAALLPEAG